VVATSSKKIGIEHFGPHNLRRTSARLCNKQGRDLNQLKQFLGHDSILTTDRYLGNGQEIAMAINDDLGI
jgi:integrase